MKKCLYLLVGFLLFQQTVLWGQTRFTLAESEYKKMRYANAIEAYEEAFKYKQPTALALRQLGDAYFKVGDMKNAERVLGTYVNDTTIVSPDVPTMFQYAQTLAQNGKYEEASKWFEKYHLKKTLKNDNRGDNFLQAYKTNIHNFYKDSTLYDVYRLDINSPQSDFSPTFYGKGIVFASARTQENGIRRVHSWNNAAFLDLYYVDTNSVNERAYQTHLGEEGVAHNSYSYMSGNEELHSDETYKTSNDSKTVGYHAHVFKGLKNENHSTDPKPFTGLNGKFHDGPCTFNKDQKVVVFNRNNSKGGLAKKSADGINKLALYYSIKEDSSDSWGETISFPFNSKEYSTAHPAFSADGKTLIFASDMPGSFGGMDLYKSIFDGKRWSRPENLGAGINTEGNEVFPFVDEHNVLYFSSNGHPGLGGLDLFKYEDEKVQHLNYPISSKKDDFGVAIWADGRRGYLSSNRHSGGFDDDIYFFRASKNMQLAGKTFDAQTKTILKNTRLVLTDEKGKVIAETFSDSLGQYKLPIEHDKTYKLNGQKVRYHDTTALVSTSGTRGQTLTKDVYLSSKLDVALAGIVTDRETSEPLTDVHVRLVDPKTGKDIYDTHTSSAGNFRNAFFNKHYNDTLEVDVHLAKEKYLSKTVKFMAIVTDSGEIKLQEKLDLNMDKVKIGTDIGKILNLNPIYFDLGKWDIREDAMLELDKVVAIMNENPTIVIELGSHTDCRSSKKYNQDLSDKRAKSSAAYVVSKGIEAKRIYGKGFGESKLINQCECEGPQKSNCTEEEHQLNRRTEFVIVKM